MTSSARGRSILQRDPLTTLLILLVYPILFCLFTILHIIYDCFLNLIANIRWQRYIYNEVRKRPWDVVCSWRLGLGIGIAGIYTAEKASEERLLRRGNVVRTRGSRFIPVVEQNAEVMMAVSTKASKQKALVPHHLALVLADKPVRTGVLIYRVLKHTIFGRSNITSQCFKDKIEKEQIMYAIESTKTLLRCCAFTGVEELSIYDETGRIKRALSGDKEWILEWPLPGEWQAAALDNDFKLQLQSSTPYNQSPSSTNASTPRSYSSALSALYSTPSTYKSSSSFQDMWEQDSTTITNPSLPRLRLTACLHRPSYNSEVLLEEPFTNELNSEGSIYHAKIKVNLLDSTDAKEAVAKAASYIASRSALPKTVDVKTIDGILQAYDYPSEPDLLIIHGGNRRVRTLHGFPPWLIRLCEVYYDKNASLYHPLSSVSIESAIASFSRSEQRYGR